MAISAVDSNTYPTSGILTSSLMTTYDVMKPQHAMELHARYGSQYLPMFQWLRAMGREESVAGDSWIAHEENRYHRTFTVKNTVSDPGANTAGVYTLSATDLDSNNAFYPRVGDIVTFPGTEAQGYVASISVSSPTAPTLTIAPLTTTAIGQIDAGTVIAITNGAFVEGSAQPTGTQVGTSKRTFYAQIFKESVGTTGTALVNEKWYKLLDDGRDIGMYYSPGYARAEYLLGLKMDGAFMFGQETSGTAAGLTVAGASGTFKLKTTKGLVPWIRDLGKVQSVTAGSFDILDLDEASLYLKQQGIGSGVAVWMVGPELSNDIENAMKTYLNYTGVDYTTVASKLFNGDPEMSAAFGFSAIKKGSMFFALKVMDQWNNPETFGATGYNLSKYGIIAPLATYKDPKTGVKLNNISTKFRALDGYSRRFETWSVKGAGGGLYVTDVDRADFYLRTHVGLQVVKANQFVLQDPN